MEMKKPMPDDTDEWQAATTLFNRGKTTRSLPSLTLVDVAGQSHQGFVRPRNEDHFLVARFGRFMDRLHSNLPEEEVPAPFEEVVYGMGVADGIGGSAGGEQASKLALRTLVNLALNTPDWISRAANIDLTREIVRRAAERYVKVKEVLEEHAEEDPRLRGFGTTVTMAWNLDKNLFLAHLGDSRAYLYRPPKLCQLTRDHTMAQVLADHGELAQEEVATHRLRHVLTKSLGDRVDDVEPDVQQIVLNGGDRLLLCSDGLTDMVSDEAIAAILDQDETSEKTCQLLVDAALAAGGRDNVTVIVARYETSSAKSPH
jgi:protein phosphatase